jgi:hypothetical protein
VRTQTFVRRYDERLGLPPASLCHRVVVELEQRRREGAGRLRSYTNGYFAR